MSWFPGQGLQKLFWIIVVRMHILVVFLILDEMLSVIHHWEWCFLWVCWMWPLLCWSRFPLYPVSREFDHKWVLNFVKAFSAFIVMIVWFWGLPWWLSVKNQPAMQEARVWTLGWENTLEEEMAIQSSILAWEIPWTEEPSGLQRVRHNLVTKYQQQKS